MIKTISLLPLTATLVGVSLAVAAVLSQRRPVDRRTFFFVLLNCSTALWAFEGFVHINWYVGGAAEVQPFGSFGYALSLAAAVGMAGAPTYWFLFAAENARVERFTHGWGLVAVHAYAVYTVVVGASNPAHELFVTTGASGGLAIGPLIYPHYVGAWLLVSGGLVLLVRESWSRRTREGRRDAVVILLAAAFPYVGGLYSDVLSVMGMPGDVAITPLLFAPLSAALGWLVFRTGYADIVPFAAVETFHSIGDAALVVDTRGVVVAANERALEAFPSLLLRHHLADSVPSIARAVEGVGKGASASFELLLNDVAWLGRVHPMRPRASGVLGTLLLLTDITDLKTRERELEDARSTLEQRVRSRTIALETANRELEAATKAKDSFLASVSHELRTPLSAMIAFSQGLLDDQEDGLRAEHRKKIEVILASGRHQRAIIDDLLDLSKIKLGRLEVCPSRFSLAEFSQLVASMASSFAHERELEFRLDFPAGDVEIETDQEKLRQILLNLLTNAIKFTESGEVTLEVDTSRRDRVVLRVRDTGPGIPPDELPTIMDEFVQVERADGMRPDGTGLGLAIARQLAVLLGGRLSVESRLGEGSTFTLELPITHSPGTL